MDMNLYYGTRTELSDGSRVAADDGSTSLSDSLDGAIWAAELAEGEGAPRVYRVVVTGDVHNMAEQPAYVRPPHPSMSWRTSAPVVVLEEVTQWRHFHGTKAALQPGDLLEPGHAANFGSAPRKANFVYFTRTVDASAWGAELAEGDGPGRIYVVEPTGPFEDDPNLTNKRFAGNPTKSFRSRAPLRVVEELTEWRGHSAEAIAAMKASLARLDAAGVEPDDG